MTQQGLVTSVTFWPDGCDLNDRNESAFRVIVEWMGPRQEGPRAVGGYRVTQRGFMELSRAGKWAFHVPRFRRWQHRWATLDEACEWARKVVNDVQVNGRTFAEWQAFHAERAS